MPRGEDRHTSSSSDRDVPSYPVTNASFKSFNEEEEEDDMVAMHSFTSLLFG